MTVAPAPTPRRHGSFRGDVDGIRAIAIVLVVAFHAHVGGFSGGFVGVDVFFVISGYLITRNLVAEAGTSSRVGLLAFWARRARRLIPALAVLVIATLIASTLILSPLELPRFAAQGAAAALYVSNIFFAVTTFGYFDLAAESSPFLHTWSLGVEEQFYLVWPVAVAIVLAACRRNRERVRTALIVVFAIGVVVSLGLAVQLSTLERPFDFFTLPTRAWEFAIAGILATVTIPTRLLTRWVRLALYVVGACLLAYATIAFDQALPYPSFWATIPVAATLLLIIAGTGDPSVPVFKVLASRPMQWVGRVSYSWYLWHWPFIILAVAWLDDDRVIVRLIAALLALPVAAAVYHWFENPVRFNRRLTASLPLTYTMALGVTLVTLLVAGGAGAMSMRTLEQEPYATYKTMKDNRSVDVCSPEFDGLQVDLCETGDLTSDTTVMLIGDSHARHWIDAFDRAAQDLNVRLLVRWRGSCQSIPVRTTSRLDAGCAAFRAATADAIRTHDPDLVVLSNYGEGIADVTDAEGNGLDEAGQAQAWQAAFEQQVDEIRAAGSRAAWIIDDPAQNLDPLICLTRPGNDISDCETPEADALRIVGTARAAERSAAEDLGGVASFDPTAGFCVDGRCTIFDDGIPIYVDRHHLAAGWTMTQVDGVRDFLRSALDA